MKTLILGASGYACSCIKAVLSKRFENVSGMYHTFNETYSKSDVKKSLKKLSEKTASFCGFHRYTERIVQEY